jgi:hypothetical protein
MEGPEFFSLMDRFLALFVEQDEAEDQEKAAAVRFKAEAPLRAKRPPSKYSGIYYDIVRDEPSAGSNLDALKARADARGDGQPNKSGNVLGIRFKMSVLEAYHTMADNPFYTEEGKMRRRMVGASERWENALHASAQQTGYESARHRRRVANKDMREVVAEILKHKPKSVEGLQLQAGACLADPGAQWIREPNAWAFMTSVITFGAAESETESTDA